jgi:large subunit ribosomal protein L19
MPVSIDQLRQEGTKSGYPVFKSGQTVKVYYTVQDGEKKRTQMFEGLIIATGGKKVISQTITVRKVYSDGNSVEQVFFIHSPLIEKIDLIKIGKVHQSKIYYMRERRGKSARLKEKFYNKSDIEELIKKNN